MAVQPFVVQGQTKHPDSSKEVAAGRSRHIASASLALMVTLVVHSSELLSP